MVKGIDTLHVRYVWPNKVLIYYIHYWGQVTDSILTTGDIFLERNKMFPYVFLEYQISESFIIAVVNRWKSFV